MLFDNHFGLFKWCNAIWYLEHLDKERFEGYSENKPQVVGYRWLGSDAESSWDGHLEWDADIIATFEGDKIILREGIWGQSPEDAPEDETEITEYSFHGSSQKVAIDTEMLDSLLVHLQAQVFEASDELLKFAEPTFTDRFGGQLDNSPEYYRQLFLEQLQAKGILKKLYNM